MKSTPKPTTDDLAFVAIANTAAAALRIPGSDYSNPYLATSDNSDAYTLGAWGAYHGDTVEFCHRGRGYSWKIETRRGQRLIVEIASARDYREGVKTLGNW